MMPKHDVKDLRVMTPTEERHRILREHMRSFHGRTYAEDESLAKIEREHKAKHAGGRP